MPPDCLGRGGSGCADDGSSAVVSAAALDAVGSASVVSAAPVSAAAVDSATVCDVAATEVDGSSSSDRLASQNAPTTTRVPGTNVTRIPSASARTTLPSGVMNGSCCRARG